MVAVVANEAGDVMGVIPQFGGQTAINLVHPLAARGIRILGTAPEDIDAAEDRGRASAVLAAPASPRRPGDRSIAGTISSRPWRRLAIPPCCGPRTSSQAAA